MIKRNKKKFRKSIKKRRKNKFSKKEIVKK